MVEKEVYDSDFGWEKELVLEPYDIVALQMAGVPDNHIDSMCPEFNVTEEVLDRQYGKGTFAKYEECKNEAKTRIEKFWNTDCEDEQILLVRSNKALFWVETI